MSLDCFSFFYFLLPLPQFFFLPLTLGKLFTSPQLSIVFLFQDGGLNIRWKYISTRPAKIRLHCKLGAGLHRRVSVILPIENFLFIWDYPRVKSFNYIINSVWRDCTQLKNEFLFEIFAAFSVQLYHYISLSTTFSQVTLSSVYIYMCMKHWIISTV